MPRSQGDRANRLHRKHSITHSVVDAILWVPLTGSRKSRFRISLGMSGSTAPHLYAVPSECRHTTIAGESRDAGVKGKLNVSVPAAALLVRGV